MRLGERGQVTIPKKLRVRFGLQPHDEVVFLEAKGELILRKEQPPAAESRLRTWVGHLGSMSESVDEFIEDARGR